MAAAAHSHSLLLFSSSIKKPLLFSKVSFVSSFSKLSSRRVAVSLHLHGSNRKSKSSHSWELRAASSGEAEMSVEAAKKAMRTASDDEGIVSTSVSALLFLAFIGLCILTIGVIYLVVQDFLQKREREKFEEEEAKRRKKEGKKGKVRAQSRARMGPRGFGQKVKEIGNDD